MENGPAECEVEGENRGEAGVRRRREGELGYGEGDKGMVGN